MTIKLTFSFNDTASAIAFLRHNEALPADAIPAVEKPVVMETQAEPAPKPKRGRPKKAQPDEKEQGSPASPEDNGGPQKATPEAAPSPVDKAAPTLQTDPKLLAEVQAKVQKMFEVRGYDATWQLLARYGVERARDMAISQAAPFMAEVDKLAVTE